MQKLQTYMSRKHATEFADFFFHPHRPFCFKFIYVALVKQICLYSNLRILYKHILRLTNLKIIDIQNCESLSGILKLFSLEMLLSVPENHLFQVAKIRFCSERLNFGMVFEQMQLVN